MYEKAARVQGDLETIWQALLTTLAANRYVLQSQVPHTSVVAQRGSKVSSLMVGTREGGYQELAVTIMPSGEEFETRFRFSFPSWTITLPSAKKSCNAVVEDFVRMATAAESPAAAAATSCPQCGQPLREGAQFCDNCGASLASSPSPVSVCAACGADLREGAKFCASCGQAV